MKRLLFISLLLLTSFSAHAQTPLAFAPWHIDGSAYQADSGDITGFSVGLLRVVPVSSLLPQTASDSRIHGLGVRAGARFLDDSYDRLHLRMTAMDLLIQRSLMTGAVHLLDYDRTGLQELNARWIGIGTGPGFHIDGMDHDLALRLLGSAGLSTWKLGPLFSGPDALSSQKGIDLSVGLQISDSLNGRITLKGESSIHTLTGSDLERRSVSGTLGVQLTPIITLTANSFWKEFEGGQGSSSFTGLGLGISFIPGASDL